MDMQLTARVLRPTSVGQINVDQSDLKGPQRSEIQKTQGLQTLRDLRY